MTVLLTDTALLGGLPLPHATEKTLDSYRALPERHRAHWCFQLGNQAMEDGFWALARGCYLTCINHYGEQLASRYNLALCEIATGRPEIAMEHLARAQHLDPEDEQVQARMVDLARMDMNWTLLEWFDRDLARDREIVIEPLQEHHLPALLWQFRDPDIARRANLPPMTSAEEVQGWWRKMQARGAITYAVLHRDLGFAGVCGLNRVDDVAYFYFWMGTDCQGKGLGPRAARLALRQVQALGVAAVYTAVYPDNHPSRSALARAGFEQLPGSGQADKQPVLFYGSRLQSDQSLARDSQALQDVLDWLDSGFVVG